MEEIKRKVLDIMSSEDLTIDDLKLAMLPFGVFGEVEVEISTDEDGAFVKLIDRDICTFEIDGEITKKDMSTRLLKLYIDKDGIVGFIEHGYGAVTRANVNHIRHMCDFIGKKIIFD